MQVQFYQENLKDIVQEVKSVEFFVNGKKQVLGHQQSLKFLNSLKMLFGFARVVPALGVALHNETTVALQKDEWIKLNFEEEKDFNGLLFSALLFKLEETGGINLIREHNGEYQGRCIYLNLNEITDLKSLMLAHQKII